MVLGPALSIGTAWIRRAIRIGSGRPTGARARAIPLDLVEIPFEYTAWLLQWVCWCVDWSFRLPIAALDWLGFGPPVVLAVSVKILASDSGEPCLPLEKARTWLEEAETLLRRHAVLLVCTGIEVLPDRPVSGSIPCSPSGILRRFFTWFSARAEERARGVTVFVVPSMRGVTGCAYPGSSWAALSPRADGTVLVHEIAHLCDVWRHSNDPDNVMTLESGGSHDRVTPLQGALLRTSRFVRPILVPPGAPRGPETGV